MNIFVVSTNGSIRDPSDSGKQEKNVFGKKQRAQNLNKKGILKTIKTKKFRVKSTFPYFFTFLRDHLFHKKIIQ